MFLQRETYCSQLFFLPHLFDFIQLHLMLCCGELIFPLSSFCTWALSMAHVKPSPRTSFSSWCPLVAMFFFTGEKDDFCWWQTMYLLKHCKKPSLSIPCPLIHETVPVRNGLLQGLCSILWQSHHQLLTAQSQMQSEITKAYNFKFHKYFSADFMKETKAVISCNQLPAENTSI